MKAIGEFCKVVRTSLLIAAALGVAAQSASAADSSSTTLCMQANYANHGNAQRLNCSSNDVRIANVTNVRDPVTHQPITSCVAGSTITFEADYNVVLNAQDRYDIGLYLSTDGDSNGNGALTGTCTSSVITRANATTTWVQLDPSEGGTC